MDGLIPVDGIKLSHELVQIDLCPAPTAPVSLQTFFSLLNRHKINLPIVSLADSGSGIAAYCCVEVGDYGKVRRLLQQENKLKTELNVTTSVGAITVFPHRSSFSLLGLIAGVFESKGYPIHSMATSISALTFVTDHPLLDQAVEALMSVLSLPENHAPFRPEIKIKQM